MQFEFMNRYLFKMIMGILKHHIQSLLQVSPMVKITDFSMNERAIHINCNSVGVEMSVLIANNGEYIITKKERV